MSSLGSITRADGTDRPPSRTLISFGNYHRGCEVRPYLYPRHPSGPFSFLPPVSDLVCRRPTCAESISTSAACRSPTPLGRGSPKFTKLTPRHRFSFFCTALRQALREREQDGLRLSELRAQRSAQAPSWAADMHVRTGALSRLGGGEQYPGLNARLTRGLDPDGARVQAGAEPDPRALRELHARGVGDARARVGSRLVAVTRRAGSSNRHACPAGCAHVGALEDGVIS